MTLKFKLWLPHLPPPPPLANSHCLLGVVFLSKHLTSGMIKLANEILHGPADEQQSLDYMTDT